MVNVRLLALPRQAIQRLKALKCCLLRLVIAELKYGIRVCLTGKKCFHAVFAASGSVDFIPFLNIHVHPPSEIMYRFLRHF